MKPITFSREEIAAIAPKLQGYVRDELDVDMGQIPAEMMLEFLAREIGPFFYNRGLYDAQAVVAKKSEEIGEAILGLERQASR